MMASKSQLEREISETTDKALKSEKLAKIKFIEDEIKTEYYDIVREHEN